MKEENWYWAALSTCSSKSFEGIRLLSLSRIIVEHASRGSKFKIRSMNSKVFIVYGLAVFLTFYGLRSVVAGIRHEKKYYWMTTRHFTNWKIINDNNPDVINIVAGSMSLLSGILTFIFY